MTIIDTTLYANGALRLTRHGAGKGETILMHVPTGRQFAVPDNETADISAEIVAMMNNNYEPVVAFYELKKAFADPLPRA